MQCPQCAKPCRKFAKDMDVCDECRHTIHVLLPDELLVPLAGAVLQQTGAELQQGLKDKGIGSEMAAMITKKFIAETTHKLQTGELQFPKEARLVLSYDCCLYIILVVLRSTPTRRS